MTSKSALSWVVSSLVLATIAAANPDPVYPLDHEGGGIQEGKELLPRNEAKGVRGVSRQVSSHTSGSTDYVPDERYANQSRGRRLVYKKRKILMSKSQRPGKSRRQVYTAPGFGDKKYEGGGTSSTFAVPYSIFSKSQPSNGGTSSSSSNSYAESWLFAESGYDLGDRVLDSSSANLLQPPPEDDLPNIQIIGSTSHVHTPSKSGFYSQSSNSKGSEYFPPPARYPSKGGVFSSKGQQGSSSNWVDRVFGHGNGRIFGGPTPISPSAKPPPTPSPTPFNAAKDQPTPLPSNPPSLEPTVSSPPTISSKPTAPTQSPTKPETSSPTVSRTTAVPTTALPSSSPSASPSTSAPTPVSATPRPSVAPVTSVPSLSPTTAPLTSSPASSTSSQPTISSQPSASSGPTVSFAPTTSIAPSSTPSISHAPSESKPSVSPAPSISVAPSVSPAPSISTAPTTSLRPTVSPAPVDTTALPTSVPTGSPVTSPALAFTIRMVNVKEGKPDAVTAWDSVIQSAAKKWQEIIVGDVPLGLFEFLGTSDLFNGIFPGDEFPATRNDLEDDITIGYSFVSGLAPLQLGAGQMTQIRASIAPGLPYAGAIRFNENFANRLPGDNQAFTDQVFWTAFHEIGHALGFGTLWLANPGICDDGTCAPITQGGIGVGAGPYDDPQCTNAVAKFNEIFQTTGSTLELSDDCGHWSENIFGALSWIDIMAPSYVPSKTPLVSAITIGAMEDLGYTVNYGAADPIPNENTAMSLAANETSWQFPVFASFKSLFN